MPNSCAKLRFPRVVSITLEDFSLFTLQPVITERFPDGVFCLAGANGLGKSTFLAALNYAITGIVPEPGRVFESVSEYYRYNRDFASSYFDGRIRQQDRKNSQVTVEMLVNGKTYTVTRNPFEKEELRFLSIVDGDGTPKLSAEEANQMAPGARHESYAEQLAQDVGLSSFDQLVFLQHFLLTFDERRHLLFWHQRELEQTLYLAFSLDQSAAVRADLLRREHEKQASRVRNSSWKAGELRTRIDGLRRTAAESETAADEGEEDVQEQYEELVRAMNEARDAAARSQAQVRDAQLRLAELTAEHAALQSQYSERFNSRRARTMPLAQHPIIVKSLATCKCALCGAEGSAVAKAITANAQRAECPLCTAALDGIERDADVAELRGLGARITQVQEEMGGAQEALRRFVSVNELANADLGERQRPLTEFEESNRLALERLRNVGGEETSLSRVLESLHAQMEDHLKKKADALAKRNKARDELAALQRNLESAYSAMEIDFVPRFRELAKLFLGLDLDIRMERVPLKDGARGINLIVDIASETRREPYQLSESQRFFVDIALRMALAQYVSEPASKACLYIDTPEGSLDIAYESRAGAMFAQFVELGFHIVMSANVNSSQLLIRLAEKCGRAKMKLCQMNAWTELSDVQIEEDQLFQKAYAEIERALDSGGAGNGS